MNRRLSPGHAVCIVGYDDNFPKEYFNDPNGTIGGDGAFLVKNTEGSSDNSDPRAVNDWGNGGSGYFWLSYYDQSMAFFESFDFYTDEASRDVFRNIDMYDFLPGPGKMTAVFDEDIYMANVYEAKNNCSVRYIGLETANAETDVNYSVYLLDPEAESPVDGMLFAEAGAHFTYAGYHTIDLGRTIMIPKGFKYSVVVKAGNDEQSELIYSADMNRTVLEMYHFNNLNQYAEAGKIECRAELKFAGETYFTDPIFDEWLTYVINTAP